MNKIDPRTLLELDIPKTDRQIEYLKAVIECGSHTKAAQKLGIGRRCVDRSIKLLETKAASVGVAPHRDLTHQTAEGFEAKRVSQQHIKSDGSCSLAMGYSRATEARYAGKDLEALYWTGLTDDLKWKLAPKIKPAKPHDKVS